MGLAAVKLASVGPGADGQAAWEVLAADSTCVHGAMAAAAGVVFPPEEELGTGDSDLDLCLKLGAGRCCPKFRIRADARSSTLFLPDLLSSPSGIVQLLLGKFLRLPPVHREMEEGYRAAWYCSGCLCMTPHDSDQIYRKRRQDAKIEQRLVSMIGRCTRNQLLKTNYIIDTYLVDDIPPSPRDPGIVDFGILPGSAPNCSFKAALCLLSHQDSLTGFKHHCRRQESTPRCTSLGDTGHQQQPEPRQCVDPCSPNHRAHTLEALARIRSGHSWLGVTLPCPHGHTQLSVGSALHPAPRAISYSHDYRLRPLLNVFPPQLSLHLR